MKKEKISGLLHFRTDEIWERKWAGVTSSKGKHCHQINLNLFSFWQKEILFVSQADEGGVSRSLPNALFRSGEITIIRFVK